MVIGEHFNNEIGFTRRTDIRKHATDTSVRIRPEFLRKIGFREYGPHMRLNFYSTNAGEPVSGEHHIAQALYFESGGRIELSVNPKMQQIFKPFRCDRM